MMLQDLFWSLRSIKFIENNYSYKVERINFTSKRGYAIATNCTEQNQVTIFINTLIPKNKNIK